jgi:GTP-binding protein LepA
MELVTARRGEFLRMDYLGHERAAAGQQADGPGRQTGGEARVLMEYRIPLSEILVEFYDQLKSRTQGYASLDYSFSHYAPAKLVKLDILVNQSPVDALSLITSAEKATAQGRALVEQLRRLIPRQLFDVPVQAAIGGGSSHGRRCGRCGTCWRSATAVM